VHSWDGEAVTAVADAGCEGVTGWPDGGEGDGALGSGGGESGKRDRLEKP
jgi:hypothetical protein